MKILAIHHAEVAMPVGQEAAAREFYAGVLGFDEVPKPPNLASRGGVWFQTSGVQIHLGVEQDFRPARKAHVALLVKGLAAFRERITAAGYEVKQDEPLEGFERVYVYDPFGNRLELLEAVSR